MNCPCGSGTSYSDCCQPFTPRLKMHQLLNC
ncbi:SEC-C metal-binding domain-containing protein [Corynebacterium diphtheriae]